MQKLLVYVFLVVITEPYVDIDYEKINVYIISEREELECLSRCDDPKEENEWYHSDLDNFIYPEYR